ncbi:MAG: hypothetical protein AB7L76_25190 [Burkholderiaceae bacterium]
MTNRAWIVIPGAFVLGYAAGALLGYGLVVSLSPNTHDKAVEAAMTGAFVTGPLCAVAAVILAAWRLRRAPRR